MDRKNRSKKFNKRDNTNDRRTLYNTCRITKKVVLPMKCIGQSLVSTFEKVISEQISGKCIVEGYVKPNSVRAVTYSSGVIKGENVEFDVLFQCEIFYPVAGMHLNCIARDISKAGIRAESSDEKISPFVLFIARDHFFDNEYFSLIKPDDKFVANVIVVRFELNDEKISIIASPVQRENQPNRATPKPPIKIIDKVEEEVEEDVEDNDEDKPLNKIAIIVPFRESDDKNTRTNQLNRFIQYMNNYLNNMDYKIFIIEQSDDGRKFNRGALLNIGFKLSENQGYDIFVFHDVDLLPSNELKEYYTELPSSPVHIASVWNRYNNNSKYFGGIVAFNKEEFNKINGYPNNFWGWGGEDDELYKRVIKYYNIKKADKGSIEDLEQLNLEEKLQYLRENDTKFMKKQEALAKHDTTWQQNGLNSLDYNEVDEENCGINCVKITVDLSKIPDFIDEIPSVNRKKVKSRK
jgi:hypothetical protein